MGVSIGASPPVAPQLQLAGAVNGFTLQATAQVGTGASCGSADWVGAGARMSTRIVNKPEVFAGVTMVYDLLVWSEEEQG
jgi:hypothetical protein